MLLKVIYYTWLKKVFNTRYYYISNDNKLKNLLIHNIKLSKVIRESLNLASNLSIEDLKVVT